LTLNQFSVVVDLTKVSSVSERFSAIRINALLRSRRVAFYVEEALLYPDERADLEAVADDKQHVGPTDNKSRHVKNFEPIVAYHTAQKL
jgi:hypothetical protein